MQSGHQKSMPKMMRSTDVVVTRGSRASLIGHSLRFSAHISFSRATFFALHFSAHAFCKIRKCTRPPISSRAALRHQSTHPGAILLISTTTLRCAVAWHVLNWRVQQYSPSAANCCSSTDNIDIAAR